ncbi:MAG TPA: DUF2934 domain-containing protein [Blastocatellia bacterium]|nr:DUF2934 domain-containing protein [Blastocatellia bacterium]
MPTQSTKDSKPVKAAKEPTSVAGTNNLATLSPIELHYLISQRAYEIYLQRGAAWGSELNDWLLAEQEITAAVQAAAQMPIQILEAVPTLITTKTRRATSPSKVKAPAKQSRTTTRAQKARTRNLS